MAVGVFGIPPPVQTLINKAEIVSQIAELRGQLHGLLITPDSSLVIARFNVGERKIVQWIGPVRSPARRIAERGNRSREIRLLKVRDAERIVAVSLARIDAHRLFEQICRLPV